jgi:hypothetical protein
MSRRQGSDSEDRTYRGGWKTNVDAEMNDPDLAARALAAAAAERAWTEENQRQLREEEANEEKAVRMAIQQRASRAVFERIGHKVPWRAWKVYKRTVLDNEYGTTSELLHAEIEITGVQVRTREVLVRFPGHTPITVEPLFIPPPDIFYDPDGPLRGTDLTLASLGRALEALQAKNELS